MRGLKILMISHFDFAGSGHRMAEAVNLYSNNQVITVNLFDIEYPKGLPRTPALLINVDGQNVVSAPSLDRFQALIDDADIIHFKGDDLPSREPITGVIIPDDKPIVCTVNGSFFRRDGSEHVSFGKVPLEDYVKNTDYRTTGDPVLLYPEYDGEWVPMPVDLTKYVPHSHEWPEKFIVAHSPSDTTKKGTDKLIDAVKAIKDDGYDIELDIIKDVSYTEAVKRKRGASLFFDQTEAGWYGNAGLEAMAYGIPTMTYLAPEVYLNLETPCLNSGNTVPEIYHALRDEVLKYHDKQYWSSLSDMSRRYIKSTHDYEKVADMWVIRYNNLLLHRFDVVD